ncbi:MAG: alanine dehydrogenase [Flavobacteriales bacterium]|nr:alanine dehydrogenase [Flavobacteriales bacterium]
MDNMNIGLIKEGKIPTDKRVPFSPKQCAHIMKIYPAISIYAHPSKNRCFIDSEYEKNGVILTDDLSVCDIIMGVKEVPVNMLIDKKIFFFFSHTIKKQPYNKLLLKTILEKKIQLIDYETLVGEDNKRIIGFGRYAGIVGCYNSFLAYANKTDAYKLPPPQLVRDKKELYNELKNIVLPQDFKIILTGTGRVANGAIEVLDEIGVKKVSKLDFLTKVFTEPVYVQLDCLDYYERIDNEIGSKKHFYNYPNQYKSILLKYAKIANMLITGHYFAPNNPVILSKSDIQHNKFNIEVIADISCDIDGPIGSTIRPSTISEPVYGYNTSKGVEDDYKKDGVVAVMAVDNLPCALPRDASRHFGNVFIRRILPNLIQMGSLINRASITFDGKLTNRFNYLSDYVS